VSSGTAKNDINCAVTNQNTQKSIRIELFCGSIFKFGQFATRLVGSCSLEKCKMFGKFALLDLINSNNLGFGK
jgi:hypothetical protein